MFITRQQFGVDDLPAFDGDVLADEGEVPHLEKTQRMVGAVVQVDRHAADVIDQELFDALGGIGHLQQDGLVVIGALHGRLVHRVGCVGHGGKVGWTMALQAGFEPSNSVPH